MLKNRFAQVCIIAAALFFASDAAADAPQFYAVQTLEPKSYLGKFAANYDDFSSQFGLPQLLATSEVENKTVSLLFDADMQTLLGDALAYEEFQIWLANALPGGVSARVYFFSPDGREVIDAQELNLQNASPKNYPLAAPVVQNNFYKGALTGKVIIVSPGHGWLYGSSWATQRGDTFGMIEDISNAEICDWYLIPMLERAGATVYSVRDRDLQIKEVILDKTAASPAYSDEGGWTTSPSTGYNNTNYRVHPTVAGEATAKAVWKPTLPVAGRYSVWTYYRAGTNRVANAHFAINHTDGVTDVYINQKENDLRWVYLGTWHFSPSDADAGVTLYNDSDQNGYVIADAIRFGGGIGDTTWGGPASGKPRWQECSKPWTKYVGAPSDVYDLNDVICRPNYADWQGGDLYISVHTNAFNTTNRGTLSLSRLTGGLPGTACDELRDTLQAQMIKIFRANWESTWRSESPRQQDLGELRELTTMVGALVELAYHDNETDNAYIQNAYFRHDAARGVYLGILRHLLGTGAKVLPLPLRSLAAEYDGGASVKISWTPRKDALEASADPLKYRVYLATDVESDGPGDVYTTSDNAQIPVDKLIDGKLYYVRVAQVNDGGESMISEPVSFRIYKGAAAQILVVNGFDRNDKYVKERDNTHNYVKQHGEAIAGAGKYSYVSATNEAVKDGLVKMADYAVVDWYLGEESTADSTFDSTEQSLVTAYFNAGGYMIVSGSEIGWDLVEKGTAADKSFYETEFKNSYSSDASNTYSVTGKGVLSGVDFTFDNGNWGLYNAEYADVIAAKDGSTALALYDGDAGKVAGITYSGDYKLAFFGFPFETIVTADKRATVMKKLLASLFNLSEIVVTTDGDEETAETEAEPEPESEPEPEPDLADKTEASEPDADYGACRGINPDTIVCKEGYSLDRTTCECVKKTKSKSGGCASQETSPLIIASLALMLATARRRRTAS